MNFRPVSFSAQYCIKKNFAQVNLLVNFAVDNSIEMANREIRFYKHYFNEFYTAQAEQTRKKIAQTLVWLREVDRLPVSILKSIEGKKGLYEIRIECGRIYSEYSVALTKAIW
jgi:hypothetical protein